jgi:hypothetical protein
LAGCQIELRDFWCRIFDVLSIYTEVAHGEIDGGKVGDRNMVEEQLGDQIFLREEPMFRVVATILAPSDRARQFARIW